MRLGCGRSSRGLGEAALERAARLTLGSLLARGARPVVGSPAKAGSWQTAERYGKEPVAIINAVIAEWRGMDRDPDVGDVWFALAHFCRTKD